MSQARLHPLEELLRLIDREAPRPWYPRLFVRQTDTDPERLSSLLEFLALEKLIDKVPAESLETGAGFHLTTLGQDVVRDPALMGRLVRGEPLRPDDVGAIIRSDLRKAPPAPYVTYALIAVNVAIFLLPGGQPGTPQFQKYVAVASKVQEGEWWRLLTCTFLHFWIAHIACNMFSLYSVGSFVEHVWGRWRYLLIYFIAGWGGSCLGMAYHVPGARLAGASGAICGVLGAVGVWFVLYRQHIRAEMARSGLWQVAISIGLIALLGYMIPGVSNYGHLGGGIAGAATALVLHLQRFGLPVAGGKAPALRWGLAGVLLAALPVASYVQMKDVWARKQISTDTTEQYMADVTRAAERVLRLCEVRLNPLLDQHPTRRDAKKVQAAIDAFSEQEKALRKLLEAPRGEQGEKLAESAQPLIQTSIDLCEQARAYLEAGEKAGRADDKKIEKLFKEVDDLSDKWNKQRKELLAPEEKKGKKPAD